MMMASTEPLRRVRAHADAAIDAPRRRRRRRRRRRIARWSTRCDETDDVDDGRRQIENGDGDTSGRGRMCTPDGGGDDGSRIATAIRTGSTGMLLLLLLLTLHPTPTSGTVYVHTANGHTAGTAAPYPSEPARFGRVFDGVVTGPGNLFLPPRGVDSRLCSVTVDVDDGDEGVGARAADGAGGAVDADADEGGPRRLDYHSHHRYRPHRHRRRHRHRRLLDWTMDEGDEGGAAMDYMDYVEMDRMDLLLPVLLETETEAEMMEEEEEEEEEEEGAARAIANEQEDEEEEEEEDRYPESTHRLRHRYLMASSGGDNTVLGGTYTGDHKDAAGDIGGGDGDAIRRTTAIKGIVTGDDDDGGSRNHPPRRQRRDLHGQYGTDSSSLSPSSSRSYSSPPGLDLDQPRPIALLVERGGCTFHEKARNAMRLNHRLVREAVLLGRDGYGRTDGDDVGGDGAGNADIGDDEEDGANRKRVYEFPDKGDADMDNANDAADCNGGGRRLERGMASHRTLQPDANDNTYDQDTIIEQGLDSVQRDMDKSEVGTARPSDLIGDGGSSLGGYGNAGNNNNVFVELPTLRIDYLVVYNDEVNSAYGKEDDLVLMDRPSNTQDVDRVDVGLVFVSRRSGLDLRRRMDELSSTEHGTTVPWPSGLTTDYDKQESDGDGEDDDTPAYYLTARDMFPSTATENGGWFLPISVDQKKELGPYSTAGWSRGSTPRDSFYWIRFVLIALLIVTPVMRGCFVWRGAGGRVQFRRNDAGRIVGLHIVRPTGSWITGWDDGTWEEGDAERQRDRIRKMTHEDVMGLPEIEYNASTDDDANEGNGEDEDDEDGDDLEGGEAADSKREDLADVNIARLDSHPQEPQATVSGDESASSSDNSPATTTTCTSCSICIDDFEQGEKIRLLPRCGHAFHTDCILPWLTERSGSCPLCKRNVMGDGNDGLEEHGSDEDGLSSIVDGDDAEERAIENEDEDVEEGRAGSRQRPQDSRATRESISSSSSNGAIHTSNSTRTRRARRRRRNGLDAGA